MTVERRLDLSARPAGWRKPARPDDSHCADPNCFEMVAPEWIEPVFFDGRAMPETGTWLEPGRCRPHLEEHLRLLDSVDAAVEAAGREKRARALVAGAGLEPAHAHMDEASFLRESGFPELPAEALRTVNGEGNGNLFLFGFSGRLKTHLAVALLRRRVAVRCLPAKFCVVPELMVSLRQAVRTHGDDAIVGAVSAADTVVLDDLGACRSTPMAMEALYLIVDRWWRGKRKGLVVTSNLDLNEVAKAVDGRLASRLAGMCDVLRLDGPDHRIRGGGA